MFNFSKLIKNSAKEIFTVLSGFAKGYQLADRKMQAPHCLDDLPLHQGECISSRNAGPTPSKCIFMVSGVSQPWEEQQG